MSTETLYPSAHVEIDPFTKRLEYVYDQDPETAGAIFEDAGAEQVVAGAVFSAFESGVIEPGDRVAVTMQIKGEWPDGDPWDRVRVEARASSADPWTILVTEEYLEHGWDPNSFRGFDITALVGSDPITDLEVRVQYGKGTEAGGNPNWHVE